MGDALLMDPSSVYTALLGVHLETTREWVCVCRVVVSRWEVGETPREQNEAGKRQNETRSTAGLQCVPTEGRRVGCRGS